MSLIREKPADGSGLPRQEDCCEFKVPGLKSKEDYRGGGRERKEEEEREEKEKVRKNTVLMASSPHPSSPSSPHSLSLHLKEISSSKERSQLTPQPFATNHPSNSDVAS